ncbi:hypothetical protein CVT26_001477 [Gymnopilus dilepis]|uniref:Uncharacterized protein n=1 Tax=Gymnopilus dilepis TaxID=231916 RepID=A0A409WBB8_9AGAR|nr:hypothetical protein CVT26_001477 [Gymnopilus dilepis]
MKIRAPAFLFAVLSANTLAASLSAICNCESESFKQEYGEVVKDCRDGNPHKWEGSSIYDSNVQDLQSRYEGNDTYDLDGPRLKIPASDGGVISNQYSEESIAGEGPDVPSQGEIGSISIIEGNVTINIDNGNGDGGFATANGSDEQRLGRGGSQNDGDSVNKIGDGEDSDDLSSAMGANGTCPV